MSRRLLDKLPKLMEDPEFAAEWEKSGEEFSAARKNCGVKLNIFQRGILQKGATAFVYLVSIAIGAFILDWLDKRLFIRLAEEAQQRGILSPDASRSFATLIEARDSTTIFAIILVGLGCGFVGWLFMRWAAKRNWSWPVMLPRAVEFRSAMERLGIVDPNDRIAFVRKYKLPVFIAPNPIVGTEQKEIRVRLYAFAHNLSLGDNEVFERYAGKQALCLDAADYERLLEEHGPKTRSAYAARIAELEQNVTGLKAVNSLQSSDIAALTEENQKLSGENAGYRNTQQTAPGRKGRAEKRENDRAPFWRVAAPLVNRAIGTEREVGSGEHPALGHLQGAGAVSLGGQRLSADAGKLDDHPQRNGGQTGRLENSEEIGHDRIGTLAQKYPAHSGAGIGRHAENSQHIPGQSPTQPGEPGPGHPPATGEREPTPGRTDRISAALATLERYTRELGTALVAFERLVARQIERLRERERERQRSRGPGMGR